MSADNRITVGSCVIVTRALPGIAPMVGTRGVVGRLDRDGVAAMSLLGDDGHPYVCFWVPLAALEPATP